MLNLMGSAQFQKSDIIAIIRKIDLQIIQKNSLQGPRSREKHQDEQLES